MNFIFMRHFILEKDTDVPTVADIKHLKPYTDFINRTNSDAPVPILMTNPDLHGTDFSSAKKKERTESETDTKTLYHIDPLREGDTEIDPLHYLNEMLAKYFPGATLDSTIETYDEVVEGETKKVNYYTNVLKAGFTQETYGFTQFNVCHTLQSTNQCLFFIGFQTSNGTNKLDFNAPYVIFGMLFFDSLNLAMDADAFVYATPDRFSAGIGQPDGTSIADYSKMFAYYLEPRTSLVKYERYDAPYLPAYAFKINWNDN